MTVVVEFGFCEKVSATTTVQTRDWPSLRDVIMIVIMS